MVRRLVAYRARGAAGAPHSPPRHAQHAQPAAALDHRGCRRAGARHSLCRAARIRVRFRAAILAAPAGGGTGRYCVRLDHGGREAGILPEKPPMSMISTRGLTRRFVLILVVVSARLYPNIVR